MITLILTTMWCMGGYAETKTYSWNLTEKSSAWTATGNETYFRQPYGFKKLNGTLTNKSITDFSIAGITQIKVGFKCLQNGASTSKITIFLVDANGKTVGTGQEFTPVNNNAASETEYVYATFTSGLAEAKGFMMKVTKFGKNILVNGASYEVTYQTKTLTSLAISGTPTITTYDDGDEFNPAGLVVTGTYDDNSTATITNGITWKTTPETLAVGTTSCSVTATVNGVTSPAYNVTGLTVVKSIKPIVFDFTANPNVWGVTPLNINGTNGSNVIAGKKLVVERVVMTATNGNDNGTCIFKNNKGSVNLRVYIGGSITFTAPEGYNLSNITFDFDNTGTFSTDVQTWETPTWTGNAHTVTFTCKTSIQVNTATIKLVAATPVTPEVTSGTIEFKAVDNDLHYATFSSDKDVVFYKDLDVFGVSVAGGKISQNSLTKGIYNVTDATAGEDKDGAVEGYYVPANTGVLVVCLEKTAPYYFSKEEAQTVTLPALPANQLKPAPAKGGEFTPEDGYKYYKLAYDDFTAKTGLGFYWGADNGGAFIVKAGTAYLAVPTSDASNAKGFAFDGETTGVENVNVAANQNKTIYNLNGQRVSNMSQAGLYIVNGKKVVIRK